jgi:hypothetical protein
MKTGWRKVLAIVVAAYALVVIAILLFGETESPFPSEQVYFVPAICGAVVSLFLTLKRPEHRLGPVMAIMAGALVTLGLSNVLVPWALHGGHDAMTVLATQLSDLAWITQFVTALVLLPLWFPTGYALNRRWAWVGRTAMILSSLALVAFVLSGTVCAYENPASDVCIEVSNPWGIEGFAGPDWPLLIAMAMAFPAAVSVFVRWRRSVGVERQQMKWFFLAVFVLLVAFLIAFADFDQALNEILFATGLTGVWVSVAIAVLKYRLYDIDRIISRTVTYAVVVGLLAAAVAGAAALAGAQFEEPWVVAATTLAVAAAFNPLRRKTQRWVDRRFNRSRYDTEQVMGQFAESLREEVDSKPLMEGFLEVVGDTMQPVGIGMWVRD